VFVACQLGVIRKDNYAGVSDNPFRYLQCRNPLSLMIPAYELWLCSKKLGATWWLPVSRLRWSPWLASSGKGGPHVLPCPRGLYEEARGGSV
jgi:hypothetical protein